MRVLILCTYSTPVCGVWTRALSDAKKLEEKGHEVLIISSNFINGKKELAEDSELIGGIDILRYNAKRLGGENFMRWDSQWKRDAIHFKPDVIIAHSYRHIHTTQALKIAKKIGCKCYLMTHAPFVDGNTTRTGLQSIVVRFYDKFIGPRTLKKFDKIVAICNWEVPYLLKLGVDENKIQVIKNKPHEAFNNVPCGTLGDRDVLFLGRISPIKDIPTLLKAAELCPNIKFSIVGPVDEKYAVQILQESTTMNIPNVKFYPAINNVGDKIKMIDAHKIFVLPSKREAFPTALVEAVARKRTIIASDCSGNREALEGYSDGHFFRTGDFIKLGELIKNEVDA